MDDEGGQSMVKGGDLDARRYYYSGRQSDGLGLNHGYDIHHVGSGVSRKKSHGITLSGTLPGMARRRDGEARR